MILPAVEIKAAKPLEILLLSGAAYLGVRSFTPLALGIMALSSPMPVMGQQAVNEIPSRVIKAVEFSDRNRTYTVNLETGRVTFADFGPAPQPEPQPVTPNLSDFPLTVYQAFMRAPITDRKRTADDLHHQIDVTLAKAGGLSLDAQSIVADLADGIAQVGLDLRLTGFRLGDLIKSQGDDRDAILRSLRGIQQALRAVR